MSDVNIESLSLEVDSNSSSATKGVDALISTLTNLKTCIGGGLGLRGVANHLRDINSAANSLDGESADKISRMADALNKLKGLGNLKLSSTISTQIKSIGDAATSLVGVDFTGIENVGEALKPLTELGKATGLSSALNQLKKLPEIAQTLNTIDWATFNDQISQLSTSLMPLASTLNGISTSFTRLPANIKNLVTATNSLVKSNNQATKSYINLWAKYRMVMAVMRRAVSFIGKCVSESMAYTENLNLFNVSLGQYAEQAKAYCDQISGLMGIDPSEWLRHQGVFMTITEGFGVASDRAYVMSKNLTQLGYDLSSFFNISYDDAMKKLTSGISGELEPLRRLGYDLSQARLKAEALSLGITKSFNDMTQAEKAQLRYHAIMTQVVTAQGDMARTLEAPANQLRILRAEVTQCARSIGNIFIPALNRLLSVGIAVVRVIRAIADVIANLVGFKSFEADVSGITSGAVDISESMEDAKEDVDKLKKSVMGFDELNLLNGKEDSSALDGLGGGFDFPLDEYDFTKGAVATEAEKIVQKFKEWLGITGEIDSWADLFDTRLGKILKTVGLIGGSLLLLKLGKGFISALKTAWDLIKNIFTTAKGNITLSIVGFSIEALAAYDMGKNGANLKNILGTLIGGAVGTLGLTLLGLKIGGAAGGVIGATLGLALAFVIGTVSYTAGVKARYREEFWDSDVGREIKSLKDDIEERWDIVKEIKVRLQTTYDDYQSEKFKWDEIMRVVRETFDLSEIAIKTPEQIQQIKTNIEMLNSLNLDGLQLTYDETTGKINMTRQEVENLIDAQRQLALETAAQDALTQAYKEMFDAMYEVHALEKDNAEVVAAFERERDKLDELTIAAKNNGAYWDLGTPAGLLDFMHNIGLFNDAQYETITEYQRHKVALEEMRPAFDESNEALANAREALQETKTQAQYFSDELYNLKQSVNDTTKSTSDSFTGTEQTLKEKSDAIIKHLQDIGATEVIEIQRPTEGLKQVAEDTIEVVSDSFSELAQGSTTSFGSVRSQIDETTRGFNPLKTEVSKLPDEMSKSSNGMTNSIGTIFDNAFDKIKSSISKFGQNMFSWGSDMMNNLVRGISNGITSLRNKVSDVANTIRSYLHFSQPDIGPLSDFNSWIPDMMSQLADGIAKDEAKVRAQVAKLAEDMNLEAVVKANVTATGGADMPSVQDNDSGTLEALYQAILELLRGDGDDDDKPINIYLGNELISQFIVKQNRRVALISGGKV